MSSVAAILFSSDRKALYLMKRRDVPVWVFPGGGIDLNESPEEAIVREVQEEMGFIVRIKRKVAFYEKSGAFIKPTHFFECEILEIGKPSEEETLDVRLFPLHALPKLFPPPYPEWLEDALLDQPEPITKKTKSITLWTILKTVIQHPIFFTRFLLARLGCPLNSRKQK